MLSVTFLADPTGGYIARPSRVENATPSVEMHPNPVPVVENATPSPDMQLKMQPLGHFSRRSYRWTHARPSGVENATPSVEMHPTPETVVENATPSLEMQLKMQPLHSKVVQGSVENAPLRQK